MTDDPAIRRADAGILRLDPTEGHEMNKTRPAVSVASNGTSHLDDAG